MPKFRITLVLEFAPLARNLTIHTFKPPQQRHTEITSAPMDPNVGCSGGIMVYVRTVPVCVVLLVRTILFIEVTRD